jgi:hypothetical protein
MIAEICLRTLKRLVILQMKKFAGIAMLIRRTVRTWELMTMSKLEAIADGMECKDREQGKDGIYYCRVNKRDCPYIQKASYVRLLMGGFYICTYHKTFEGVEDDKRIL